MSICMHPSDTFARMFNSVEIIDPNEEAIDTSLQLKIEFMTYPLLKSLHNPLFRAVEDISDDSSSFVMKFKAYFPEYKDQYGTIIPERNVSLVRNMK